MKKILSIALVLVLVLSLGATAFANSGVTEPETPSETSTPTYTDATTATFKVKFTDTNDGAHPEETFTFSEFTFKSVKDAGVDSNGATVTKGPDIDKIADVKIAAGASEGTATINLPTFDAVGVYTYSFNQAVGTTAGVTYYKNDAVQTMMLVVTVVEENGLKRIAAVHVTEDTTVPTDGSAAANKTGEIENTYESGKLTVDKVVTGNLGDKSKPFSVTITFTPAEGETIKSAIAYTITSQTGTETKGTVANNTITVDLKDSEKIEFTNVPEGVTWKVVEADYTTEANGKYDAAKYSTQTKAMVKGATDTCTITNNKDVTVDTGITLDSLPYILIVAVVLAASVVMIVNKRRSEV